MTDYIKSFREEYKKAYEGILPDEMLEKGNPWLEQFLTSLIKQVREDKIKERLKIHECSGRCVDYIMNLFTQELEKREEICHTQCFNDGKKFERERVKDRIKNLIPSISQGNKVYIELDTILKELDVED